MGAIWYNKVNQVDRNVCCMDIEDGRGVDMINIFSFVKSKQIKVLYNIMHSGNGTWSALDKYWVKRFVKYIGEDFFVCKCLNIKRVNIGWHYIILFECTAII